MNPVDLAVASVKVDQAGQPGLAELMRAVCRGHVALLMVGGRAVSVPKASLTQQSVPLIAVLGDDDYHSTGPTGWLSAKRVAAHTASAVIHAAAATADSYAEALKGARQLGSCALIETDSTHAREWAELWRGKPALVIMPRTGPHPILPAREMMH